jgi:hypothetical protein
VIKTIRTRQKKRTEQYIFESDSRSERSANVLCFQIFKTLKKRERETKKSDESSK